LNLTNRLSWGLCDAGSINRSHKILRCWAELFVMSVPLMVNCFVVLTVIVNDARARIEHDAGRLRES